jgi:hypothetical protein
MMVLSRSPKITYLAWGELQTADGHTFKDVKLWPGGAREWDWNEYGTHHQPGIQPAEVDELIKHGAEIVILSKGQIERLQVMDETLDKLAAAGIEAEVLETNRAVERYNQLVDEGRAVGALIHSTC